MYFLWSGHKLCITLRCCHALLAAVSAMHLAYIVTCHCVSAMRVRYDNVAAAVVDTYIYLDQVT